jgi:hypothetical protein
VEAKDANSNGWRYAWSIQKKLDHH